MPSDILQYPMDLGLIARRRRGIRTELLAGGPFTDVKIAVLGGSTTADVTDFLELFLLGAGIRPTFLVSEYGRYYEEAVVDSGALRAFAPDVVFVHTTRRNVREWPPVFADEAAVDAAFSAEYGRFEAIWTNLARETDALIVQNNFDPCPLEPLGHLGASAHFGQSQFVARLNAAFAAFARRTPRLRINDIHTLAAHAGLSAWTSERNWLHYRMALTTEGSALVAHAVARTLRAAFGKSKKCLVLDLDDTLWGGVVGEEGVSGLRLGHDTPEGEAYVAFQRYCRALRDRGVLLAVCSKNDETVAKSGFSHPDSVLRLDDFSAFVANWEPKPDNLRAISRALGIGLDGLVFVDDNPRERELVRRDLPEVAVAKVTDVTTYAAVLDREGYFEPFTLGKDDRTRATYYADNAERATLAARFEDYGAYLDSLGMEADIGPFSEVHLDRVTQLVNKTNQFNLTTRRYTPAQIAAVARDPACVTLSGRLRDKFGDNGLVSVVIGRRRDAELHVEAWLMSCRVLKRELELAMFDALVTAAREAGVRTLVGYYAPTPKNAMVASHYEALGFELSAEKAEGTAAETRIYRLDLARVVAKMSRHIRSTPHGSDHDAPLAAVS